MYFIWKITITFIVHGISGKQLKHCNHYLIGKHYKIDDPSRRKEVSELIHSYIYASSEKYLGSAYYFVTFINTNKRF